MTGLTANQYLINDPSPADEKFIDTSKVGFGRVLVNDQCRSKAKIEDTIENFLD
jgi:hypothetical protein